MVILPTLLAFALAFNSADTIRGYSGEGLRLARSSKYSTQERHSTDSNIDEEEEEEADLQAEEEQGRKKDREWREDEILDREEIQEELEDEIDELRDFD